LSLMHSFPLLPINNKPLSPVNLPQNTFISSPVSPALDFYLVVLKLYRVYRFLWVFIEIYESFPP
jgi:hypothetical protein